MAKNEVRISIAEYTFSSGKKKNIHLNVDGKTIQIPVEADVYAYCQEQFVRKNPTGQQSKKFGTLMNIVRAAYLKGLADGNE